MNLNKLFKQLKIKKKLTIAFTLLATIPVFVTGLFGIIYTVRLLEDNSLAELQSAITTMQLQVDRFLNEAKNDVFYLKNSFVFQQFILALQAKDHQAAKYWRDILETQLSDFVENRGIYYQVRYLDHLANEVLRIEYDGIAASVLPEAQLSGRQDIFYLYSVEQTVGSPGADDELFFTPVELQHGISERIVPAISYFVPVYCDSSGRELQGILVANVYAQPLFEILSTSPPDPGKRTLLADKDGFYIFNSTKKEQDQLLALHKEGNLENDFPQEVRDQVLSGKEGLIDHDWDEIVVYAQIHFTGDATNFLVLLHSISKDLIHKPVSTFMKLVVWFAALSFAIALLFGLIAANQFARPIKALSQGSRMLARGRLDKKINIATNDEIEQLADDFNRMAESIRNNETQLKEYAEGLEFKVRDRTRELRHALTYLENLIASSVDAIITLEKDGTINFISRGAEAILGLASADMVGTKVCSRCECLNLEKCPILTVSEEATTLRTYGMNFLDKQGGAIPLTISASPLKNEEGEITGILMIGKDMTEHQKLERQIQQAEKLSGIGQLAAGMAHQLNTPLASILLSAQMLQDLVTEEDILYDINSIEYQADHCKNLIQDLLSFSRAPLKEKFRTDLAATVEIVLRLMQKEFEAHNIRVVTDLDPTASEILANKNQIEQLFFNLFKNACDAMPAGGTIQVALGSTSKQKLRVVISDTGHGIDKAILSKIFDPFFTTKAAGEGTGLGLSVCYGIVEQHNGSIEVDSKPGQGTTFTIRFPVSRPQTVSAG